MPLILPFLAGLCASGAILAFLRRDWTLAAALTLCSIADLAVATY
jgi:hypothetical protein